MNIFDDRFSTAQLVAATGLPNHTLQSWLKRDLLVGQPGSKIEGGGVSGSHRRFTIFTVMEVAVAKALTDIGLSAADALRAAARFAHSGDGPLGLTPERCPAFPFDIKTAKGFTLLCVSGQASMEVVWQPGSDCLANVRHRLGSGFVVLEVNDLFDRVVSVLGYHPSEVIDLAYSKIPG